jgi:hypothetical protein
VLVLVLPRALPVLGEPLLQRGWCLRGRQRPRLLPLLLPLLLLLLPLLPLLLLLLPPPPPPLQQTLWFALLLPALSLGQPLYALQLLPPHALVRREPLQGVAAAAAAAAAMASLPAHLIGLQLLAVLLLLLLHVTLPV